MSDTAIVIRDIIAMSIGIMVLFYFFSIYSKEIKSVNTIIGTVIRKQKIFLQKGETLKLKEFVLENGYNNFQSVFIEIKCLNGEVKILFNNTGLSDFFPKDNFDQVSEIIVGKTYTFKIFLLRNNIPSIISFY